MRFRLGLLAGSAVVFAALIFGSRPSARRTAFTESTSLGAGLGEIRWVATLADAEIAPPALPVWAGAGTPMGARFGPTPPSMRAAWYLITPEQPTGELWHVDKEGAEIVLGDGVSLPWKGGSGSLRVEGNPARQFLYLLVPGEGNLQGAVIRMRLSRFDGARSEWLRVPF